VENTSNCRVCPTDRHLESSRGPEYMFFLLIIEVFSGDPVLSSIYGVFELSSDYCCIQYTTLSYSSMVTAQR